METKMKLADRMSQSITMKAFVVVFLTLLLLIPGAMIQDLIQERKYRSIETIEKINAKWSNDQTINGPILTIPYEYSYKDEKNKLITLAHELNITPENLNLEVKLYPEERHFGIYKSILYKSDIEITGKFTKIDLQKITFTKILWDEATVRIGISDLRGITNNLNFKLNNLNLSAEAGGSSKDVIGQGLIIGINNLEVFQENKALSFTCNMKLKGSNRINFIPLGKNTKVHLTGSWKSPGYIGSFSPDHTLTKNGFDATWNVLHFNRTIPEMWIDNNVESFDSTTFGVNLVDTVDHYQQNERSAKYALMFIALTFVVFFFVEVLTRKKIHPIQYLLVGIALILFYSLLLSISEQLNFGIAYLISSFATIALIVVYAHSILKNKFQTGILASILAILYIFLYVVLQLEDIALLIGSIGLFVILAIIMFFSRKINWNNDNNLKTISSITENEA